MRQHEDHSERQDWEQVRITDQPPGEIPIMRPPPFNDLLNAVEQLSWDLDDELNITADVDNNRIVITNETFEKSKDNQV